MTGSRNRNVPRERLQIAVILCLRSVTSKNGTELKLKLYSTTIYIPARIMLNETETKVIDPEFGFFDPMPDF